MFRQPFTPSPPQERGQLLPRERARGGGGRIVNRRRHHLPVILDRLVNPDQTLVGLRHQSERRMLIAQRNEWRTLIDALNRAAGLETA